MNSKIDISIDWPNKVLEVKVVVYTAITGGRDTLVEPPSFEGVRYVAFLDRDSPPNGWMIRPVCDLFRDPCRNAKIHKVLAHMYFPDVAVTLWVDGNIILKAPIDKLVEECLQTSDMAIFRHPERDCIYDEAEYCIANRLDNPETIKAQMTRYRAAGYPPHNGLALAGVLLRRHTPAMAALNNTWWAEICAGSRRDQLSFNYAVHTQSLKLNLIPGVLDVSSTKCSGQGNNPYFSLLPHTGDRAAIG
jgi:hypothetical protein